MFEEKKLTGFRKFKKTYKPEKMKGFAGFDGRVQRKPVDVYVPKPEKYVPSIGNKREQDLARQLGDDELAHRVIELQKKNPYSTVVEMLVMDWLDKNLADYVYQARVNGGYRPGGLVPDFVVRNQSREWLAILVNGNYWHQVPGTQNDTTDKLRLVGSPYKGSRISKAVIIWESRLMRGKRARDEAVSAAVAGVELGI